MQIDVFELPPIGTNAYLLSDASRGEAVLIDAPLSAWETIAPRLDGDGLTLKAVLLTHGHFDHVLGAAEFNRQGIPVYAHEDDRELLNYLPQQMAMFGMPGKVEVPQVDHWYDVTKPLELLGHSIEVRHTPGHCPGNVTFYFADEAAAFVGDVIFAGSYGRTDLPGGSTEVLRQTFLNEIYTLPDNTLLYPGHGPSTSVGVEKKSNPLVQI
ncbi:MBL fold metallo-hydrolase [Cerasicoccus maritimus]|uniref:MBL fold metallo-hydrolase n=1 Tax=Cerasicoccus maritimus TaxID=490089 RepID=UPI002852C386|nr:MBL fold metallo-hydrolase [Cerasicoccus maritimus]